MQACACVCMGMRVTGCVHAWASQVLQQVIGSECARMRSWVCAIVRLQLGRPPSDRMLRERACAAERQYALCCAVCCACVRACVRERERVCVCVCLCVMQRPAAALHAPAADSAASSHRLQPPDQSSARPMDPMGSAALFQKFPRKRAASERRESGAGAGADVIFGERSYQMGHRGPSSLRQSSRNSSSFSAASTSSLGEERPGKPALEPQPSSWHHASKRTERRARCGMRAVTRICTVACVRVSSGFLLRVCGCACERASVRVGFACSCDRACVCARAGSRMPWSPPRIFRVERARVTQDGAWEEQWL